MRLGYVFNTCHKYSPGQHWVAMVIIVVGKKVSVYYYDSQGDYGFETKPLDCDNNPECPPEYKNYKPDAYGWFD